MLNRSYEVRLLKKQHHNCDISIFPQNSIHKSNFSSRELLKYDFFKTVPLSACINDNSNRFYFFLGKLLNVSLVLEDVRGIP